MKMTEKQKRFCDEYLIDLNATQACIRAGYSKKTAKQIGQQNLSKVYLKNYIEERLKEKEKSLIATQDEVLKYLTSVLRGESESEVVVVEGCGDGVSQACRVKKRPDEKERLKAGELLTKVYGLTNTQKVEGSLTLPVVLKDDVPDDEE